MAWLTTGVLTGDGVAFAAPCHLGEIIIGTNGTNDVTVNAYDNASAASGKKLIPTFVQVGDSRYGGYVCDAGVVCDNGIYMAISGVGAQVSVRYKPTGQSET